MSQDTVMKRFVLRANDAWELGYRLEALRQVICARSGVVLGVEVAPPTATGLLRASVQYLFPLKAAGPRRL